MILRAIWNLWLSLAMASPPGAAVDLYVSPRGVQSVFESVLVHQVNGRYLPTSDVRLQASRLGQGDGRFRIQATAASTPATAVRVDLISTQRDARDDIQNSRLRAEFIGPPLVAPPSRIGEGRTRDLEIRNTSDGVEVDFVPSELDIDIGHMDIALGRTIQAEGVALNAQATHLRVKNLKVKSRGDLGVHLSFGLDAKNQKISIDDVYERLMMDSNNLVIEPGEIVLIDAQGNERDASGNAYTVNIPGLGPANPEDERKRVSDALKAEFLRNKELIVTLATPRITEVMSRTVKKIVDEEVNPKLEMINQIGITQDITAVVNGLTSMPDAGIAAQYCLNGGAGVSTTRTPWVPADSSRDISARLTREDVAALLERFKGKPLRFGDLTITPDVPQKVRFSEDGRIYVSFEGDVEHPALANLQVEGSKVHGKIEVPVRLDYENGILKASLDLSDGAAPVENKLSLRVPTRDRQTGATVSTPIDARVRFNRAGDVVQARVVLDEGAVSSLVNYAQTTGLVPAVIPMGQGRTAEFVRPIQVYPDAQPSSGPVASDGASVIVRVPHVRVPIPASGEMAELRNFDNPATGDPWEYVDLDLNLRATARVEEVDGVQKIRVYLPPSRPQDPNNHNTRGVRTARIMNISADQANGGYGVLNALTWIGGDELVAGGFAEKTMNLNDRVQEELSRRPLGILGGGRFADTVRHPEGVLRYAQSTRASDGEFRMNTRVVQLPTGGVQVTMTDPKTGAFLGRYSFSAQSAEGRMYLDHLRRFPEGTDSLRYRFTRSYNSGSGQSNINFEAIDPRVRSGGEPPPAVQSYIRQKLLARIPSRGTNQSVVEAEIRRQAEHTRVEMTTNVSRSGDSGVRVRMIDPTNGALIHEYLYSDTSSEGRMYLQHAAMHGATSPVLYRAIPAGNGYQLEAIDPNRDGRRPLFEFSLDDPRAKPYLDLVTSTVRTHSGAEVRVAQPSTSRPHADADRELSVGVDLIGNGRAPQVPLGQVNVESLLNARIAQRGRGMVPPIGNTQLRLNPATGEVIFSGDFVQRPKDD